MSYYGDNFHTQLQGGNLEVKTPSGALQTAIDLRWLSDRLLDGAKTSRGERAAAGAAIRHLLSLHEAALRAGLIKED